MNRDLYIARIDHELSWTPAEGKRKFTHSSHLLEYSTAPVSLPPGIEDEVLSSLSVFKEFDGDHNDIAVVFCKWHDNGMNYAYFDMKGFRGFLSSLINGRLIAVRIWCDRLLGVHGDTCRSHMLIGQRQWRVAVAPVQILRVETEAYERTADILNSLGMRFMGRAAQQRVWLAYLLNIRDNLTKRFDGQGIVTPSPVTSKRRNPWSPRTSYPSRSSQCS